MASTRVADRQIPSKTFEKVITFGIYGTDTGNRNDTSIALPFNATILRWKISTTQSMSCVFDIKKNGTSIISSNYPTLTASTFSSSSTLTGWTPTLSENDILLVSVTSKNNIEKAILQLVVSI